MNYELIIFFSELILKLNRLEGLILEILNNKCTYSLKFQDNTFTVMKISLYHI
jgi:hypothetical protein